MLTGHLRTVEVYAFSEHKAKLYATCILCIYIHWIFGFHHAFGRSVIIMLRILNIGLVNRSVNVTEVYHRRVWKAQYFECLVLQPTTGIFFALLGTEGQVKSLTKKFVLLARNTRSKKSFPVFPNSRSVTLKERNTVNSTANLSTWRNLINQSMIPESGIMERPHQRHVSRLRVLFPSPGYHWSRFARRYFSYLTRFFAFCPQLRSLVSGYFSLF